MAPLEGGAGVLFIHKGSLWLFRHGSFAGNPFGISPSEKCCSMARFNTVETVVTGNMKTVIVKWKCNEHKESAQAFGSDLVGWWPTGKRGHIALWNDLCPAPPKIMMGL